MHCMYNTMPCFCQIAWYTLVSLFPNSLSYRDNWCFWFKSLYMLVSPVWVVLLSFALFRTIYGCLRLHMHNGSHMREVYNSLVIDVQWWGHILKTYAFGTIGDFTYFINVSRVYFSKSLSSSCRKRHLTTWRVWGFWVMALVQLRRCAKGTWFGWSIKCKLW